MKIFSDSLRLLIKLMLKGILPEKFVVIAWKINNKKNHFMNVMSQPIDTLITYIIIWAVFGQLFKRLTDFILVFEIVQQGLIMPNSWKPRFKHLRYFKSLLVKQIGNWEINSSIYISILEKNLPINFLKNIQPRKI